MKTLRIISSVLMVMFFTNIAMAQVETNEDTSGMAISKASSLSTPESKPNIEGTAIQDDDDRDAPSQSGFHLGFRYQPTFGKLNFRTEGDETITANFDVAHGFGGSLNFYFNNWVGTHLEVMGMRQAYEFEDGQSRRRVDLSYINVPLMFSFNTNYGKPVNFNVAVGPYFGVNTGARTEVTNDNGNGGITTQAVVEVNPVDIGIGYGAGFDFGFGETRWLHLNIGFRGTEGLIDIGETDIAIREDQFQLVAGRSRMQTYAAYVGLMFKL